MLKQRHETQLGCALTDAFTALVDVVAKGRWGGSALVLGTALPHAGLPVRAATRQGLAPRQGARVPEARIDHAAGNAARSAVLRDAAPALAHRAQGRRRLRAARCALLAERRRRRCAAGTGTSASTDTVRECSVRSKRASRRPKKREAVCRFRVRGLYTRMQAARSAVMCGSATPSSREKRFARTIRLGYTLSPACRNFSKTPSPPPWRSKASRPTITRPTTSSIS